MISPAHNTHFATDFLPVKRTFCLCLLLLSPTLFAQSLEEGQRALSQGRYQAALEELNKYLDRKPQDAEARFSKGLALVMLKQDEEAITVFADLVRDFPELPEPYNNLAVLYARAGQYEEARDALESALVAHPSYATAHENLGDIYTALANAAYNRAVVLEKNNPALKTKLDLIAQLTQLKDGAVPSPQTLAPAAPARQQAAPAPKPAVAAPATAVATSTAPILARPATAPSMPRAASTAPDKAAILAALERWSAAWSSQDVPAYLATYSQDFVPASGVSRSVWESQRRTRVVRPRSISIQVLNPQVVQEDADHARVLFLQIYESDTYSDQVRKQIKLKRTGDQWLIYQESVVN